MKRRNFLAASLASATAAPFVFSREGRKTPSPQARGPGEYHELRRYHLPTPQRKLADTHFQNALIPGLNRLGIPTVGVFNVSIGTESPTMYVLTPSISLETLVNTGTRLAQDAEYVKARIRFSQRPREIPPPTSAAWKAR